MNTKTKTKTTTTTPVDLTSYRMTQFGRTWGIIVSKDVADQAIAAGQAKTSSKDGVRVQAVKGLYSGKDGKTWCGKGGADEGKRFVTFPTMAEIKKASEASEAPSKATTTTASPASPASPASTTASPASIQDTAAALKAAGFTAGEVVAALKAEGLIK